MLLLAAGAAAIGAELPRTVDGYWGIWYFNQPSGDEYVYKYRGGFATYPQQQSPIAIHAPAVRKTFFLLWGNDARQAGTAAHGLVLRSQ